MASLIEMYKAGDAEGFKKSFAAAKSNVQVDTVNSVLDLAQPNKQLDNWLSIEYANSVLEIGLARQEGPIRGIPFPGLMELKARVKKAEMGW